MAWTEKMVEDLKIMWKQGLTTGEIGKRLGVSKNSIVGKVHRLQLDARPSPIKKKDESTPLSENLPSKGSLSKDKTEKNFQATEEKNDIKTVSVSMSVSTKERKSDGFVHLTDLDNHTCRWPIGDPKDENFHFCGKKVRIGQTYCDEHANIAYVKAIKK